MLAQHAVWFLMKEEVEAQGCLQCWPGLMLSPPLLQRGPSLALCWWLLCSLRTLRWNSSAYHGLWAPLNPLQPLKMKSGTCSALVRKGYSLMLLWTWEGR